MTLKICSDICPWTLSVPQSSQFVREQIMSADKYPSIFLREVEAIVYLYNNQINARALIGQSAMIYCAINPIDHKFLWVIGCGS